MYQALLYSIFAKTKNPLEQDRNNSSPDLSYWVLPFKNVVIHTKKINVLFHTKEVNVLKNVEEYVLNGYFVCKGSLRRLTLRAPQIIVGNIMEFAR